MLKKMPANYFRFLRWTLAILMLAYVAYFIADNIEQFSSLKQLSPLILVFLLILNLCNNLIYAVRLKMIVEKKSGVLFSFWPWIQFFMISRFLSLYAGQAGNVYRAVKLKQDYQVSITKFISSMLFITWFDTCIGLLFAFIVIALLAPGMVILGMNALVFIILLLFVFSLAPFLFNSILSRLKFSGRFFTWIHGRLSEMSTVVINSLKDPFFILKLSLTGLLSFLNSTLVIYLCFRGLGLEITLAGTALFFTVLKLCNRVVITPGNLGFKEIAYGILAEQLQIGMAQGILVSIITRVITLIVTTVIGIAFGGYEFLKPSKNISGESTPDVEENIS